MKKYILALILLGLFQAHYCAETQVSTNNLSSIIIDKIFIKIPSEAQSVVYQINNSKIIITPQEDGTSLIKLLPQVPNIKNLMQNNQIVFNPFDKMLFPTATLTTDEETKSISIDSVLNFTINGSTSTLNSHSIIYLKLLTNYLKDKGFSSSNKDKLELLYKNKPAQVLLNIMIDSSGGYIHSIDLIGSKNGNATPSTVLSIDNAELKKNGIVIEY